MADTKNKRDCLDCLREIAEGKRSSAKRRQRSSSYCTEHVYSRSKVSRERTELNEAIRLLKSADPDIRNLGIAALNKTNKYLLAKIPDEILLEYAEQWKAQARSLQDRIRTDDALASDIKKRRPYINSVASFLWMAFVLENRRLPSAQEEARLKYVDADPFYEQDLAHARPNSSQSTTDNSHSNNYPSDLPTDDQYGAFGTDNISPEDAVGRDLTQQWGEA